MSNLLETIEAHLVDANISATAFGRDVMGDPNFVPDLRQGRDYRKSTEQKVLRHIQKAERAQT